MLDRRRRLARRHRRDRRPAGRRARLASRSCTGTAKGGSARPTSPASARALADGAELRDRDGLATSRTIPADLARLLRGRARRRRPRARLALRRRRRRRRTGASCGASSAAAARPTRASCSGSHVRDLTGGFKCFRREVLEAIDFDDRALARLRLPGRAHLPRGAAPGFRVVEVPIVFRDREHGQQQDVLADRARGDVAGPGAALSARHARAAQAGLIPSAPRQSVADGARRAHGHRRMRLEPREGAARRRRPARAGTLRRRPAAAAARGLAVREGRLRRQHVHHADVGGALHRGQLAAAAHASAAAPRTRAREGSKTCSTSTRSRSAASSSTGNGRAGGSALAGREATDLARARSASPRRTDRPGRFVRGGRARAHYILYSAAAKLDARILEREDGSESIQVHRTDERQIPWQAT